MVKTMDKCQTKQNAKAVLKEYQSLIRQNNSEALIKLKEINDALERLPEISATILRLAYMDKRSWTSLDIALELYRGESTINRYKATALLEFAEAYHLDNLIASN